MLRPPWMSMVGKLVRDGGSEQVLLGMGLDWFGEGSERLVLV